MTRDDLGEHVTEIGRYGKVASFEPMPVAKARPPSANAAADVASDYHHRVAVSMVGSAVAVFRGGASELGHRDNDGIGHAVAEVGRQRGKSARELVEARRDLAG